MKKYIIQFTFIFIIIFFLFKYNILIKKELTNSFYNYIKTILPSMFPIILITNIIKHKILSKTNNKLIRYLSLMLSFSPSNSTLTSSENELLYSSNINPLFSYIIISNILNNRNAIIITVSNLILNYILLLKNINKKYVLESELTISKIINISFVSSINILGVIMFFKIIIVLASLFIPKYLLFFIEIVNGYEIISKINNNKLKIIMTIFLNSFGGLSIFFQMKSINEEIKNKYLLKKIFVSIIITIITILILTLLP